MAGLDRNSNTSQTLRSLVKLLVDYSEVVIKDWEAEDQPSAAVEKHPSTPPLPSRQLFEAQRVIRGACGMVVDLVQEPRLRLYEVSTSFALSQAFDTSIRAGVPDILAKADEFTGISVTELSKRSGVDEKKLVRLMRVLCSDGLYNEVRPMHYSNSRFTRTLAGNAPAKAFHRLYGTECTAGGLVHLPATLVDPDLTGATSVTETAFQRAFKTTQSFWDVIEHGDPTEPATAELRDIFPLAMVGQGQMNSPALIADYPWASLGNATVVDVGGGVGSMSMDLAKVFPDLSFVVEDLPVHIKEAKTVWDTAIPGALDSGRVQLTIHDFFTAQPVKDAAVYVLRNILHDWADDECVIILKRLRDAMGPNSRVLVADHLIHPPLGSAHLKPAPAPLPANYGQASTVKGQQEMVMLALFNGRERTPEELEGLARRAGLKIEKIWECRAPVDITELRLLEE